ncbi:hypothetical protein NWFMUON74_59460 [Nocardia wallacei]|uniref:Uncharacterized protein n=1 Tax=Nocardia wallacei TaxID=480035 RepID=A0A7G1KYF8_9NOCA|nr:hypothetical protein NWFMUON74_59460 [Nocardia wallacei]
MHPLGLIDLAVGFDHSEVLGVPRDSGIEVGNGDADMVDGDHVIGGDEFGRIGSAHPSNGSADLHGAVGTAPVTVEYGVPTHKRGTS